MILREHLSFGIILGSSRPRPCAGGGCSGRSDRKLRHYVVLTGILQNPSGLSNAGLYMGNLICS
jgi:hypothetical protein